MQKFIAILMPFILCGDEISDILYLADNWQTFGNTHLRTLALLSILLNLFICGLAAFYMMFTFKGFQDADMIKIIAFAVCFGWMPVYAISLVMVWGKLINLFDCCNCLSAIIDNKSIQFLKDIIVMLAYVELFLEDIPQLIIQTVNNFQTDNWSIIQIVSISFTVTAITFQVLKFMFCKEKKSSRVSQSTQYM